jgi:phage terminase small subunit
LAKREVKQYIDQIYLDTGYRNRFKLAEVLDDLIDRKLEEAEESEVYSNKDIADLVALSHKIRMDEMKAQTELEKAQAANIKNQTNVQINNAEMPFGQGNYGELMKKLLVKEGSNG